MFCHVFAMQELKDSMQEHLRLHFNNEEASDEQVHVMAECAKQVHEREMRNPFYESMSGI
jgi:hypothetical protein